MSLVDRTNETILLSTHRPMESPDWSGLPGWDGYSVPTGTDMSGVTGTVFTPAELNVDVDGDSSCDPRHWVHICWTDDEHDSDRIKLTYEEAGLLHDRLGLILGRSGAESGPR